MSGAGFLLHGALTADRHEAVDEVIGSARRGWGLQDKPEYAGIFESNSITLKMSHCLNQRSDYLKMIHRCMTHF